MSKQTWEIKGKIQLLDTLTGRSHRNQKKPLEGVTVEVLGATTRPFYKSWGVTYTDADGNFRLCKTKNKNKRHFKVLVRLADQRRMVRVNTPILAAGGLGPEWYQVFESGSETRGPTVNIGTKVFSASSAGALGDSDNIKRAHMYYWVKTVIDALARRGGGIEFTKPVIIAYPAKVITGVPYANDVFRTAYIHGTDGADYGNVDTVLHEIMHLWVYEHNTGTSNWVQAATSGNSTHEFQEKAAIAFHEGFAEWGKDALMTELFGREPVLPANRHSLAEHGLNSFESLERNDNGVTHALHLLITPEIWAYKFGTSREPISNSSTGGAGFFTAASKGAPPPNMPATPSVTLFDVLRVFLPNARAGWPTAWQVGTMDNGLNVFMQRAADILRDLRSSERTMIVEMLTSGLSTEPTDFLLPDIPQLGHSVQLGV